MTVYKLVTLETVDEDIYDMGERKRKLSTAVLADHRHKHKHDEEDTNTVNTDSKGNKRGRNNDDNNNDDDNIDDVGAVGRILQKALMRANMI